ncbi:MAG: ribonuclease III [Gammaproteobacteria bacterium]|nr:ribonuclease III [Gammaproteobacteria bacterium]
MSEPLARLEAALGHRFKNPDLLQRALTHRSRGAQNNERLEFLGDGLVNFVIGEALFRSRPQAEEGDLSRLRASLVREESLARVAGVLALGDVLALGPGELRSGGFRRESILADALEAVLGAVFLDDGFEAARDVCLRLFAQALTELPDPDTLKDPKTRLQEWLQGRGRPLPEYLVLNMEGPPHRQTFTAACRLRDTGEQTEAAGGSRKQAEQSAAEQMLNQLNETRNA